VGVLLANSRANRDTSARMMRGVFSPGDCWLPTDDLFRQDADGDYWLMGTTRTVIRTEHGPVYPQPICDALGTVDTIDLAVAHGAVVDGRAVSVASVTTWPGRELRARDLDTAFQHLPAGERPDVVQVVDEIPVTPSHRPAVERVAELGVRSAAVWTYDAATATYVDPPARG
jgi:putative long chain acyl-CoA synthase